MKGSEFSDVLRVLTMVCINLKKVYLIPGIVIIWSGAGLGQFEIYSENFDALSDGATSGNSWNVVNVFDCDGEGFVFEVQSGSFIVSDAEGTNCCDCTGENGMNNCGNSGNFLRFGPFSVSGVCQVDLSFSAMSTGTEAMECLSNSSVPFCDGETDLVNLRIFLDGIPINFSVCCGDDCNQVDLSFSVNASDSLSFNIFAGTQNPDEQYSIDDILLVGVPGPSVTQIHYPDSITICEGDPIAFVAETMGCSECIFTWRDEDQQIIGNSTVLEIDSLIADDDGVNRYTFTVESGGCLGSSEIAFDVFQAFPNEFIGVMCQDDNLSQIDIVAIFEQKYGISGIATGPGIQGDQRTLMSFGLELGPNNVTYIPEGNCQGSLVLFNVVACNQCMVVPETSCIFSGTEGDLSSIVHCTFKLPDPASYDPESNEIYAGEIPNCSGGAPLILDNPHWYTFTATSEIGLISFRAIHCEAESAPELGLQYALVESCFSYDVVACDTLRITAGDTTPIAINFTDLDVGSFYFLVMDGYEGSVCSYEMLPFTGFGSGELPPTEPASFILQGSNILNSGYVKGFVMKSLSGACWFISINGNGEFQSIQTTCDGATNDAWVEIEGSNLFLKGEGQQFILKSPLGECYGYSLLNGGTLSKHSLNCEEAKTNSSVQIEKGNLFFSAPTKGIILQSPNEDCWQLSVDNGGQLSYLQVICPD